MNYPRLLNSAGVLQRSLYPIKVSLNLNITPLSTATMTLPKDEYLPARGFVELFTPYGSAGVFRVRSPHDAYGDEITTADLEHAIAEVGDYLVKDDIDKMMAANTAVTELFKHYKGSHWKLGSVSALGSGKVAVEAKYSRVLDAVLSVLQQKPDCMMSFDFSKFPWTVNFVAKGKTVSAEGRLERNVNYAKITYDDTDLCTRLYYETFSTDKSGNTTSAWKYKDADTKKTYGIIEKSIATDSNMTSAEITATVDTYLNEHKEPLISIEINAEELTAVTGESMDKFTLGKLFRLVIPEYKIVIEKHVTAVSWSDVYGDPRNMIVRLAFEEDTVVTFLHDIDSNGSSKSNRSGGGGGYRKSKEQWKEYYTKIDQTDHYIEMYAAKTDKVGNILEQAGLYLNSKGVLVYAKDNKNQIGAQLKVNADAITTEVKNRKDGQNALSTNIKQTAKEIRAEAKDTENRLKASISVQANKIALVVDGNNNIKPASIVAAINGGASTIKLSADHIDIDGIVEKLESWSITTTGIECDGPLSVTNGNDIECDGSIFGSFGQFDGLEIVNNGDIDCAGKVSAASLKVGSYNASWKSFSYDSLTYGTYRYWLYGASATATTAKGAVGAYPITGHSSNTIYYLGHS